MMCGVLYCTVLLVPCRVLLMDQFRVAQCDGPDQTIVLQTIRPMSLVTFFSSSEIPRNSGFSDFLTCLIRWGLSIYVVLHYLLVPVGSPQGDGFIVKATGSPERN